MAFRLTVYDDTIEEGESLLMFAPLNCFDMLGNDDWSHDRDGMLAHRSAFELVREQLNAAQLAELDQIDAYWRTHAEAFNKDFAIDQAYLDKKTVLTGLVEDGGGRVPEIPRSHWWWWPIEGE